MNAAIRSHVESRFEQAVLEKSPYPHILIGDFFPDDVYRDILRYNPFKTNEGRPMMEGTTPDHLTGRTPYSARKQINFHANDVIEGSPEQKEFWRDMKDCFLKDDWFPKLVASKYRDYFSIRFGDIIDDADFYSLFARKFFLQRQEPGFFIGPHTEVPARVFAAVFSFAENEEFEEYGTQMLVPKDRLTRCWGCDHHPESDDYIVKKIAPYRPNHFFVFYKTRHSFHSVRLTPDNIPNQRYGMQFQFMEPPEGLFKDLSAPDLMQAYFKKPKPKGGLIRRVARAVKREILSS